MTKRLSLAAVALVFFARNAAGQLIRGTIVDSASGRGIANARVGIAGTTLQSTTDSLGRFTITGAPSGDQTLAIHTMSLDSLNAGYSAAVKVSGAATTIAVRVPNALQIAGMACPEGYGNSGIVLGRLKNADDSTAALSGTVSAEWETAGGGGAPKWVSAATDARGRFALCGVPLDTALSLRAVTDDASGEAAGFRVSSAARFGRTEVVLHRARATTAILAGVVTDSANNPITNAEVMLPDLGKGSAANEQGAFALRDIPAGLQRVLVRHVGFAPVETQLTFVAGQTVQRHITLRRTTALDSVVITEKSVDHALDDFEVNRKLGLGHFITRAELAKQEGRSTAAVLTSLPGIKVFTMGPYGWVGSGRKNGTSLQGGGGSVQLDPIDADRRAPLWDCYALVYLDNHLEFRGQKFKVNSHLSQWEPLFEINSIPVAEIEAIEYYASSAQTPMKYSVLNSECGVLVIHTLRYHPRDTTTASGKPPLR